MAENDRTLMMPNSHEQDDTLILKLARHLGLKGPWPQRALLDFRKPVSSTSPSPNLSPPEPKRQANHSSYLIPINATAFDPSVLSADI